MTTTDKRAAAIAALIVRDVAEIPDRCSPDDQPEMMLVTSDELTHIVMRRLAALEADDGRALLRNRLADWCVQHGAALCPGARADTFGEGMREAKRQVRDILDSAAPEQPAPEPAAPHADDEANAGTSGKGRTDGRVQEVRRQADHLPPVFPGEQVSRRVPDIQVQRGSVADDAASGNECVEERAAPAQPDRGEPERVAHAADEKRIAEWERKAKVNCVHFANERVRYPGYHLRCSQVDAAGALMREFSARAAKAEAEIERLRGRDAEPFDWDAAPSVQEWIDENLPEREPRAGSKMVELHPDEVIADRGESRRVAGWLKDLMAENADLRAKLADAKAELAAVDAAIADRGVPERDCSLPLPERVSNIISELKNWRHEAGTAQAEVERLTGIIDDTTNTEATNADTVADLRAKLADAERERDDLREQVGDKGFSLLQQERDEAVADMLSVAQQVGIVYEAEGHAPKAGPTPAILRAIAAMQRDADDAPRLRSAGVSLKFKLTEATAERDAAVAKLAEAEKRLTTAMCNVAEAEDERNDARSSCFAAKAERDAAVAKLAEAERQTQRWKVAALEMQKQRDAALAAQNARAGLLGRAVEAISECLPDEDLNDLSTHFHMECKRHHFERLKDVRDEMECALRAAKPEPAAEPVPAAADAKPGDEVLREFLRSHATDSYSSDIELMADTVAWLCRRALEVRP